MSAINPRVLNWFEQERAIDGETVVRLGIFTGRREAIGDQGDSRVVPDDNGEIIVFPFIDGGAVVGEKYRARGKKFWQRPGGKKTFFNADILDDPGLIRGDYALVITEGEIDALSGIDAGYPFVVSVPDGAPPARDKDGNLIKVPEDDADIDPANDEKYSYIFNNWDRLKKIKRIILAVDSDEPGIRLAEELARRLDRVRCLRVEYPADCKDLNEVKVRYGSPAVMRVIGTAKPYPVSGVYRLSEIPPEPELAPKSTGWGRLDHLLKVFYPAFMVVTGLASNGKSTWTMQLVSQLADKYGWGCAIASFEMRIDPFVTNALIAPRINRPLEQWHHMDVDDGKEWIEKRFVFIAPDPEKDEDADIDWLIKRAEAAVIRHGIRVLLIDPWNEIEHVRRRDETLTEYVGRALRQLKKFARDFGVLVIVVVHPTKAAQSKKPEEISLYDCSDSAHFANKADLGVVVARMGTPEVDNITSVFVKKVRYQPDTGKPGHVDLTFDQLSRTFSQ